MLYCEAEDRWRQSSGAQRTGLKASFTEARREFDRHVQRAKREHWRQQQDQLAQMSHGDPKRFWKYVGQLGVAQERKKRIPMEIIREDGTVSRDIGKVRDIKVKIRFMYVTEPNSGQHM